MTTSRRGPNKYKYDLAAVTLAKRTALHGEPSKPTTPTLATCVRNLVARVRRWSDGDTVLIIMVLLSAANVIVRRY
jgi:hypothetical protein